MTICECLAEPLSWGWQILLAVATEEVTKPAMSKCNLVISGDPCKKSTAHLRKTQFTNPHGPVGQWENVIWSSANLSAETNFSVFCKQKTASAGWRVSGLEQCCYGKMPWLQPPRS